MLLISWLDVIDIFMMHIIIMNKSERSNVHEVRLWPVAGPRGLVTGHGARDSHTHPPQAYTGTSST